MTPSLGYYIGVFILFLIMISLGKQNIKNNKDDDDDDI